ncbi:hypothetical protein AK812_SmicGene8414 [Symbiodinium microadriaticum]|uniref:Uncharacterized protein n=1 Tax=Symbiodinium microadriaticum TaxID=2951 RepID=A0A1Q9EL22_SYMMI|nr:hypothetical protein AK812_SmicGene8414 [Symbiodinium microadriaticum]
MMKWVPVHCEMLLADADVLLGVLSESESQKLVMFTDCDNEPLDVEGSSAESGPESPPLIRQTSRPVKVLYAYNPILHAFRHREEWDDDTREDASFLEADAELDEVFSMKREDCKDLIENGIRIKNCTRPMYQNYNHYMSLQVFNLPAQHWKSEVIQELYGKWDEDKGGAFAAGAMWAEGRFIAALRSKAEQHDNKIQWLFQTFPGVINDARLLTRLETTEPNFTAHFVQNITVTITSRWDTETIPGGYKSLVITEYGRLAEFVSAAWELASVDAVLWLRQLVNGVGSLAVEAARVFWIDDKTPRDGEVSE